MFMDIAKSVAQRGTCFRLQVGAVLVNVDNPQDLWTGYNGPGSGEPHCSETCAARAQKHGCSRSHHAEMNALRAISPSLDDMTLDAYVTDSPCIQCAKRLVSSRHRIRAVYFEREYRLTDGLVHLKEAGLSVYKVTLAGNVIDWETNEVIG